MKILRYELGGQAEFGVLHEDGSILELAGSPFDGPPRRRPRRRHRGRAHPRAGGAV